MIDNLLPKDQEEVTEWTRLQGQLEIINELDQMYDSEEFETFYKSPASTLLSPWHDRRKKEITDRLNELMILIKQRYEL